MQKVVSINLNGNAYHLEEGGYEALRAYLDGAAALLKDNPDRAEIVSDLEQAIAEKCAACLTAHKTVVTAPEVDRILAEMGPVRDPEAREAAGEPAADRKQEQAGGSSQGAPRRLYQIREGAILTGVCNGLSAYLGVDATIVRLIFIVLAVLTHGAWVLVYVALSFFVPFANTAEERAAAHGVPFSAQELVDGTKRQYRQQQREWARQWRRARRGWRGWPPEMQQQVSYAGQVWARAAAPIFGIAHALLFVVLALAIVSFVNEHSVFGWTAPASVPLWAGILILVVLFQVVTAPLHVLRHTMMYGDNRPHGYQEIFGGLLTFVAMMFAFWLLYQYVPQFRDFVHQMPAIARDIWQSLTQRVN
jgi:phage shock protein PspC (stress-responsive transcriptional regulator)